MNNHILIASGTAVVSLATGAACGYLYAKKKLGAEFDARLENELCKTKKHYTLLMTPKEETELESFDQDVEEQITQEEHSAEEVQRVENLATKGKKALTDYRGISNAQIEEKEPLADLVQRNIFEKQKSKKQFPHRDPETGKFVPKQQSPEETPYIISHEDFLRGDLDFEQENLKYFIKEDTLLDTANEVVDNGRIGEVNLTLFPPDIPEDRSNIICVRNEGLQIDYEIQLTHESLSEYIMGFDEGDLDDDGRSYYDSDEDATTNAHHD